jgi:hypothetical protein
MANAMAVLFLLLIRQTAVYGAVPLCDWQHGIATYFGTVSTCDRSEQFDQAWHATTSLDQYFFLHQPSSSGNASAVVGTDNACGFGALNSTLFPYFNVAGLPLGSFLNNTLLHGCGACVEVECTDPTVCHDRIQ